MRKQKGFSLIELLIVVAIILIIAAIAIPNLLRSKMSAADSAAASTLRTLNTAQVTYATAFPALGYAPDFKNLGPNATGTCDSTAYCLVDNVLGQAGTGPNVKGGYQYYLSPAAATATVPPNIPDYAFSAEPLNLGTTGTNVYCTTSDAVIRSQRDVTGKTPTALGGTAESIANCQNIANYAPLRN